MQQPDTLCARPLVRVFVGGGDPQTEPRLGRRRKEAAKRTENHAMHKLKPVEFYYKCRSSSSLLPIKESHHSWRLNFTSAGRPTWRTLAGLGGAAGPPNLYANLQPRLSTCARGGRSACRPAEAPPGSAPCVLMHFCRTDWAARRISGFRPPHWSGITGAGRGGQGVRNAPARQK